MVIKIWKSGHSLVCTIPARVAQQSGLKTGDYVEIIAANVGELTIKTVGFKDEPKTLKNERA